MRIESSVFLPAASGPQPTQAPIEQQREPLEPTLPVSGGGSTVPAPGPQPVAPGNVEVSLTEKIATILEQAGVSSLETVISAEDVAAQAKTPGNAVSFEKALAQALQSFLTDDEDIESPLSLMSDMFADPRAELLSYLNDGSSRIMLVTADEGRDDNGAYPAEQGESIANHWVFAMTMPEFSDHLFWAIVPRNGEAPYNYGFN